MSLPDASDKNGDKEIQKVVVVALFGLGRAGTIHLNSILTNPRIVLKYIVEEDASKCEAMAKSLDSVQFLHPSMTEVLYEDKEVDAVIVATPTSSHEEYISRSLRSGKAVFAEKPIAETTEAVDRVYKLAIEVGKPLFCAFNRRFDPSFSDVQKRVRSGELGHVHQIKLTSRDSPLPAAGYLRISGGIFHDCMVHDIDLMTHILGEYPVEVSTMATALIPEIAEMDDFDNVVAMFKFTSGNYSSG